MNVSRVMVHFSAEPTFFTVILCDVPFRTGIDIDIRDKYLLCIENRTINKSPAIISFTKLNSFILVHLLLCSLQHE